MALRPIAVLSISGLDDAEQKYLDARLKIKPILRQAARKTGSLISRDAKTRIPPAQTKVLTYGHRTIKYRTSGLLRKAVTFKATTSRKGIVHSIIGVNKKMIGQVDRWKSGNPIKVVPYKYLHLVEKGFMLKAWKSGKRRFIAGKHMLDYALTVNTQNVEEITRQTLKDGLERDSAKRAATAEALL